MGRSYQDLIAWQKAVEEIYKIIRDFPKDELYGLTSQLRARQFRCQAISLRVIAV